MDGGLVWNTGHRKASTNYYARPAANVFDGIKLHAAQTGARAGQSR
jgi:hypothetical protein